MSHSIRIKRGAGPRREIRRVAGKCLSSSIDALETISVDPDEAVHHVRKDLKELRALVRLVRDGLGESRYQKENRVFRSAARGLARFRDASVRVKLVEALQESSGEDVSADPLRIADERVRDLYENAHAKERLRETAKESRRMLKRAKKRIRKWPLDDGEGFGLFRAGLTRTYAQGRLDFARCLIHPTATNFHEWRKQCKYLRHQLAFLKKAAPGKMKRLVAILHELADRLGEDHDQAVLAETLEPLAAEGVALEGLAVIHADLEKRHRRLMDHCLAAGRRFFAAAPEEFVARIEGWWNRARPAVELPAVHL